MKSLCVYLDFFRSVPPTWLPMETGHVARLVCVTLLISGGVIPVASAQAPNGSSASTGITTDRPAITDSSAVVPNGVFQAENGLLDTGNQARRTLDFPETVIRVGIGPSTELRFTAPDFYQDIMTPAGPRSGFGDLAAGMKQQLRGVPGGFEVSVVLTVSFPTGTGAISSHGYDPSFQMPWSRKLSSNWTAAGMLSVYVPTQNGSHTVVGESTFLVDRQLTNAWDAFIEYAGDFPQAGGPRHLLHFGTAYKIAPQQQLDLHVGVGLSAAAVDHFVGIGYSFRFRMAGR
jgi:hypothetical protein